MNYSGESLEVIPSGFRPLLSGKAPADLRSLKFPVLASPKLDGIRAIRIAGRLVSRTLKDIPNDYVREWCVKNLPDGMDGELLLEDFTAPFEQVSSAIMSREGKPAFVFAAFDYLLPSPFEKRFECFAGMEEREHFQIVPHEVVGGPEVLQAVIDSHVAYGFEGTMIRSLDGAYKYGRSTTGEGILLKIKAFDDEEAVVVAVVEEMHNTNAAERNEVGRLKRSSSKAGKVGKGRVGALVCVFSDGTQFEVSSGLTDEHKHRFWADPPLGKTVTVCHQPPPGGRPKGKKPRIPSFKGIRHD